MYENLKKSFSRFSDYSKNNEWSKWLDKNTTKVKALFENDSIKNFIFEPFKGVFTNPINNIDSNVYSVITQVAIINAVLAGLPGKMGVGVFVSMALEAWMAYAIAKHVGLKIDKPTDVAKYFGILAGITTVILFGIKTLLGFGFSLFSVIPELNPLILAELFVTNFVGILFWIGFKEAKENGSFLIPKRMITESYNLTKGLFKHQVDLLKNVFNMENIQNVGNKLVIYLKGEIPLNQKEINGELFATTAMAYLLSGHYEKLQGPLGKEFIEAIRLRWSNQISPEDTIEDIAYKFREYDAEQLDGVINTIKGKMFEIIVTNAENADNDTWKAKMHDDESYPGTDIIFTNINGETMEVSLKAVDEDSKQIIEHALAKYPDAPIMTTDEMAKLYEDNPMVFGSGISHEELKNITEDRLDELLSNIKPIDTQYVIFGGITVSTAVLLYPFVIAYFRKKISYKQLQMVFQKVLGEQGLKLVAKVSYGFIFGPIFAWYLLAKGVKGLVVAVEPEDKSKIHFISYQRKL